MLLGEQSDLFTADQQAVLNGMHDEYEEWAAKYDEGNQEAGLQMQSLYEQAQALATAYYESSDTYQNMQDVELDQIEAIRENTAGLAAATNAYKLAQEQSKGAAAVSLSTLSGGQTEEVTFSSQTGTYRSRYASSLAQEQSEGETEAERTYSSQTGAYRSRYAYGLDRVPYDGFPLIAHEGERLLTAQEAREQDAAEGKPTIQIIITNNNFTGSTEEMAGQLAEVIASELERAAIVAVPR